MVVRLFLGVSRHAKKRERPKRTVQKEEFRRMLRERDADDAKMKRRRYEGMRMI